MKEDKWLACEDIELMMRRLSATLRATGVSKKKEVVIRRQRLFSGGCCRRFAELLTPEYERVVRLVEEYADTGTKSLLADAEREFTRATNRHNTAGETPTVEQYTLWRVGLEITSGIRDLLLRRGAETMHTRFFARKVARIREFAATAHGCKTWEEVALALNRLQPEVNAVSLEAVVQCHLLRDIFGNPFRPVAFDPAWCTEHTVGIAAKMYEERDFAAMPILADALEEAGCDNQDILTHCREPGVHVRGCWVVDLVLGKS